MKLYHPQLLLSREDSGRGAAGCRLAAAQPRLAVVVALVAVLVALAAVWELLLVVFVALCLHVVVPLLVQRC